MELNVKDYMVLDGDKKVLGRLASAAAKALLNGKHVAIINAEKAVLSGDSRDIVLKYRTRLNLQEKENPEHSPYWSRRPDMLVKRVVRGMLPYRRPKGKEAFRRLRVFVGKPEAFASTKVTEFEAKDIRGMYVNTMTVEKLAKLLGYKAE